MKKINYIFILFILFGFVKGLDRAEYTCKSNSELNKQNFFLKEKTADFHLKITHSKTQKKPTKTKKRKKAKGTQPALYVVNEYSTKINVVENDFIFSSQEFYYPQLFFSDENRGPPVGI